MNNKIILFIIILGQGPAGEVTDKLQQGTGNVMTGPQCITAYPEIITLSNDYVCTEGATICLVSGHDMIEIHP